MTPRKTKPFLSLFLVVVLVLSFGTSALAAEVTPSADPVCTEENCIHDRSETNEASELQVEDLDARAEESRIDELTPVDNSAPVDESAPGTGIDEPVMYAVAKAASENEKTTVCNHPDTITIPTQCTIKTYCTSCGELVYSKSKHTSAGITRDGCNWYEYCSVCRELLSSGSYHAAVSGTWSYHDMESHIRTGPCTSCGETTTEHELHSLTTKYAPGDSTRHVYGKYCTVCNGGPVKEGYESHSFDYGSFTNHSETQHRRTKSCANCGYSEYEYADHSLNYGEWTTSEEVLSQMHQRTVSCSCGYSTIEYENHSCRPVTEWTYYSETAHERREECDCGYWQLIRHDHSYLISVDSTTESEHSITKTCSVCEYSHQKPENHNFNYGSWVSDNGSQHKREAVCDCGFTKTEYVAHEDVNGDGSCDECSHLMTRFSVTVPVSLVIAVSENGDIYTASDAVIINTSTAAVKVTGVTITASDQWTIVPYDTNMADAKVNAKQIGVCINGAATSCVSAEEQLSLSDSWQIAKDASLPLVYDAVVSATTTPINEQVLTVVFVMDWAA